MRHTATWHAPQPLWRERLAAGDRLGFARPDILRFESDDFMDRVESTLAENVDGLDDFLLVPEELDDPDATLRLYLPVHSRYYMICASLVCRTRGLPERKMDVAAGEKASFVIRRKAGNDEQGWFGDDGWKTLDDPATVDGAGGQEERIPLFWMSFEDDASGVTRRLALGLIPVGAREKYEAGVVEQTAVSDDDLDENGADDPRLSQFAQTVYKALDQFLFAMANVEVEDDDARDCYTIALLDLLVFLEQWLPDLHDWAIGNAESVQTINASIKDVLENIRESLIDVWGARDALNGIGGGSNPFLSTIDTQSAEQIRDTINAFSHVALLGAVVDRLKKDDVAEVVSETIVPTIASGSTYVARCVYERPNCALHEGPVVSSETVAFQFATFYDPNVPMRPIRMTMPVDTTVQGLRKAGKSFQVQMSNALREQVERFTSIKDVDDPIDDRPTFNLGVICSFSIPIITICALILLMIVVSLLNIVFFWIPLLRICLPLKLSSK